MNKDLFERLLYEEEGPCLDFKKAQYGFVRESDEVKSELLKDIVGFANAWRRTEGYILIGVEEVRGGRSNVIGIPESDHLDDHALQQFVNNLTNQPVRFRYEALGFEGKQVGVITIEEQTRPFYLKRDYGKLRKDEVYVRRGSSTDPQKAASIEEIAQMRIGWGHPSAELTVALAPADRDVSLGATTSWDAEFCQMPNNLPELPAPAHPLLGNIEALANPTSRWNEKYYRDLALYEFCRRAFRPIRIVVANIGQVAAKNVRVQLLIPTNIGTMPRYPSQIPEKPKQRVSLLDNSVLKGIRPIVRRDPGEVTINKDKELFRIEIDCRDLQPGRQIWSDIFYISKRTSGELALSGLVYADNLPQPKQIALTISVTVKDTTMTFEELRSFM